MLKMPKPHLWKWFWANVDARRPKWTAACDTLRVLEGEPLQLRGKVIPFPTQRKTPCP